MTSHRWLILACTGAIALAMGLLIGTSYALGVAIIVGGALLFSVLRTPSLSGHLVIILGLTALPDFVPSSFAIGTVQFQVYQPFLVVYAIYTGVCLRNAAGWHNRPKMVREVAAAMVLFAAALCVAAGYGIFHGYALVRVVGDVRNTFELFLGAVVGAMIFITGEAAGLLKTLKASLWISAVVEVLAAVGIFSVNGRTEAAQLWSVGGGTLDGGDVNSATRLLTPATALSVAVICFCVVLTTSTRMKISRALPFVLPALAICFLSYSRNQLVALAVAIVFVGVSAARTGRLFPLVRRVTGGGLALGLSIVCLAWIGSADADQSWLDNQMSAYVSRVIDGFDADALQADSSVQDRALEDSYMLAAIADQPIFGVGLGYEYKPATGNLSDFSATPEGRAYAHNFYLWTWMKGGLLALAAFLAVVLLAIRLSLSKVNGSHALPGAGAVVAAFSVISVVSPVPTGSPGALLFGVAIGAVCGIACKAASVGEVSGGPLVGAVPETGALNA
jgi:O-antigen ligase